MNAVIKAKAELLRTHSFHGVETLLSFQLTPYKAIEDIFTP